MRAHSVLIVFAFAISGCATTHPSVVQSPSSIPVPSGKSKLVITRNTDALFLGVQARIDVNGERAVELWRGESYAKVLSPGKVIISTDAWSTPGRFMAHFNVEPNKEYILEISPRGGHYATSTLFGVLGSAVDAAVDENTGPFAITLKELKPTR